MTVPSVESTPEITSAGTPPPAAGERLVGLLMNAAPTVAFVVVNVLTGQLVPALIAAGAAALAAFGLQLARRARLRRAGPGLLIVAVCAAAAAFTGQARGFFLVPTLVPFAVILVCLGSVAAGRPLTGLVLNRVIGGPARWFEVPALRRVYVVSTLVCVAVNVVNAVVQVVFYRAGNTVVLGATHVATGPVFAAIVAVTVVFARRVIGSHRAAAGTGGC